MANELRLRHTTTGATITAIVWSGAARWNGTSLVLPATIADAAWGTGAVACGELQTLNNTRTAYYVGQMPAVAVSGAPVPIDAFFFEGTPTPGQAPIGQQSFWWDGTQIVPPPRVNTNGQAGIDWGNIGNPTASVVLSSTIIDSTQLESEGLLVAGYNSGQDPATLLAAPLATLQDLIEADRVIDTSVTPWSLVLIKKGSGQLGQPEAIELLRQKLYDVAGGNVTNTATILGRSIT